ncbi:hypothetical protein BDW68DRAFT_172476 [Aspergillus falconensis]
MRLTPFANLGLPRTVVHPDGLVLRHDKDEEIRLPRGTMLALPLSALQRDETLYADPETFDVFQLAHGKHIKAARSALAVDEGFKGFSFGQHACPGRFWPSMRFSWSWRRCCCRVTLSVWFRGRRLRRLFG